MTEDRFSLYRLCPCGTCEGRGRVDYINGLPFVGATDPKDRCKECRGEGRVRQEVATCATEEAVGVAIVTLGREGEFAECPFGLLDREGETNQKWLINPWLPSARNVTDAARVLARSKKR